MKEESDEEPDDGGTLVKEKADEGGTADENHDDEVEVRPTLLHPGSLPTFDAMHLQWRTETFGDSSAKASARQVQPASVSTFGNVMSDDWLSSHNHKLFRLP